MNEPKSAQDLTFMSVYENMMSKLEQLNNASGLSKNVLNKLTRQPDSTVKEQVAEQAVSNPSIVELFQNAVMDLQSNIDSLNTNLNEVLRMIE